MLPWLFICTDTATSRGIGQDQPDRGVSALTPEEVRHARTNYYKFSVLGPACYHVTGSKILLENVLNLQ